jgi:hypothetical protein
MKAKWLVDVGATLAVAMWLPIAAIAATLSGTVKDLGELESAAAGVKGVTVVVRGPDKKEIKRGTSGGPEGTYRIGDLPTQMALTAVFDKLHYHERNKEVPIELTGDAMTLNVFLWSDNNNDPAYNGRVAESMVKQAHAGDFQAFSLLKAESVRASQRLALRTELEKRLAPQAVEFAIANSVGSKITPDTRVVVAGTDAHGSVAGSWAGWVTDEQCGAKGANAAHKAGAEKCLEKGGKLVLYNSGDKKLYKLDKQDLARRHLGHEVMVRGSVAGDSIQVDSISPIKE